MSNIIAPGKWAPNERIAAKAQATRWGVYLILGGLVLAGLLLVLSIVYARDVNLWLFGVPALPMALGVVAVFPDIFTPLAKLWLEKKSGAGGGGD